MRFPSPGQFRTLDELRRHAAGLGLPMDGEADLGAAGAILGQPLEVLGRRLGNRFATHPMEGWDGTGGGSPTELTRRRWRRFGRSGAALVWGGEAFAVTHDGRANPNQLCLGPASEGDLAGLLAEVRAGRAEVGRQGEPVLVGLQLTHSGRFARPTGPLAPCLAQDHPLLARKYGLPAGAPLLTDGELEAIGEAFVAGAEVAARAGFDFVDVKCCHGYLLHELLAARTRPGPYGGDLQGRTRLFRRIVAAIAAECPGLGLGVRLSAGDTVPYEADPDTKVGRPMDLGTLDPGRHHFGLGADRTRPDLGEARALAAMLPGLGVRLLNVSLGSPYWNPHLQRPAAYPPSDGYLPPTDPLVMVQEHLRAAAELKAACPSLTVVGTGYSYLQEWLPQVAAREVDQGHVDLIGLGRLLLAYPELPDDLLAGRPLQRKRLCRTFSDCTTAPRNGMVSGCYPLDPFYKGRPEAAKVKDLQQELRR